MSSISSTGKVLVLILGALLAGCAAPEPRVSVPSPLTAGSFPPPGATALPAGTTAYDHGDIAQAFGRLAFDGEDERDRRGLLRLATPVAIVSEAVPDLAPFLEAYGTWLSAETGVPFVSTPVPGGGRIVVRRIDRGLSTSLTGAACALIAGDVTVAALQVDPATAIQRTSLGTGRMAAATVFLPAGGPDWLIEGCLAEEVPQALGLMNDMPDLGPSAFNDDGVHRWPTALDLLMLRLLHDPALVDGMARPEAEATARQRLDEINPAGVGATARLPLASSRRAQAYNRIAATVFAPQTPPEARPAAAEEALLLAPSRVPSLHCAGLFALGKAERGVNPARAAILLEDAGRVCGTVWPGDRLRQAVIALERAAAASLAGQQGLVDALAAPLPAIFETYGQPRRARAARGLLSAAASGT
ncbi:MAG: DUF2927 domain-containing protein [Pseudomonadota bacterium]